MPAVSESVDLLGEGSGRPAALTPCPHRPPCTACPRYGDPDIAPAAAAVLAELARAHGLGQVPLVSGPVAAFRSRARLAIRGRIGTPKIGLFEEGTHRVVHVPQCRVHHPLINRVAQAVRGALADARVPPYADAAHLGIARYLQVVVERRSQSAQVVLVANSATAEPLAQSLELIRERLGNDLHSLWFNSHCERGNAILGPTFERIAGPESVVECFGGANVHYPPGAFGQSNLEIAGHIIGELRRQVPSGACVAEFYAGAGAIGLSLLEQVRELRLNEVSPHSLQGLRWGLAELDASTRARISVLPGPASSAIDAVAGADVVIVDPPRKGLDEPLAKYLATRPPQRLLYVSCDPASLLRDATQLLAAGRLRLAALTAFNLMPYTDHVEALAQFDIRGSGSPEL
jgi:tRNA/tmRNA/rRNA uracil-C5-methylase (TrmA/RlmC/RlmD family)